MKLHPRVTKATIELVKRFEGLRRRAARLPDGGWTIGYGHSLSAREGAVVSPEDAEALLYYDLSQVATKVEAWTFAPLNQNQFEALTAFAFNIDVENFRHSTVLKRVNEGQHLQAAAAMELWRKAEVGGEGLIVDALVRRRAAEKAHYLTPPEGFRPSPTQIVKPAFDFSVVEAAHGLPMCRAAETEAPVHHDDAHGAADPFLPLAPPMLHEAGLSGDRPKVEADPDHPFPASAPMADLPTGAAEPAPSASGGLFGRPFVSPDSAAPLPDGDQAVEPGKGEVNAEIRTLIVAALNNRAMIWGVAGSLGLLFFALAIILMLSGRPSVAHLLLGSLGVLMLTAAGIYFLLRRMDEPTSFETDGRGGGEPQ